MFYLHEKGTLLLTASNDNNSNNKTASIQGFSYAGNCAGRLQCMGSLRVGHDFTFTFHFNALEKEMATHSSVLAWRIPGTGEPGGLPSMGLHRVRHN